MMDLVVLPVLASALLVSGNAPVTRHPSKMPAVRLPIIHRGATAPNPGGIKSYAWNDGSVYDLTAAPGQISDIQLQPGEALVSVAAGDTARWVIGDTTSGSGATKRTHILIKPTSMGLRTNLVIATDRRVYFVTAESVAGPATVAISWSYPRAGLIAFEGEHGSAEEEARLLSTKVAVERLNFDYRIEGRSTPWRPLRAFDDGSQVFIEFPSSIGSSELPPLFILGTSGKPELVNYRLRGRYYVVDRLFKIAELRMGEKRQLVVRIARNERSYLQGAAR